MRRNTFRHGVWLLAMAAIAANWDAALTRADEVAAPPPSTTASGEATDRRISELLEIRRELGAGVLEGSVLAGSGDVDEFADALRRVRPATAPLSPAAPEDDDCERRYRRSLGKPAMTLAPPAQQGDFAAALRAAAQQLEATAATHEAAGSFERADELFRLAARLRRELRRPAAGPRPSLAETPAERRTQ